MSTDNLLLLNSILFLIIYMMRHKNELLKRLIILVIGSAIVYVICHMVLFEKDYFNIYTVSTSVLVFTALEWMYCLIFANKKK